MPLDASFWNHIEKQMDEAADAPKPGCLAPSPLTRAPPEKGLQFW